MELMIAASCVLAFLLYHWLRYKGIRGPAVLPILGSIPEMLANYDRFYDWITDLLLKFGMTYTVIIPWVPSMDAVVTCNPENVEHITRARFANYPKGPPVRSACMELLGDGIFNSDGKTWRIQRSVAALEFNSHAMVESIMHSVRVGVTSRLMPVLLQFVTTGQEFDLQDVLLRFTFDNVCTVASGVNPNSLSADLADVPFASAINHLTEVSTSRFLVPPLVWKAKRWLGLGGESKMASAAKIVDEFTAAVIESRRSTAVSAVSGRQTDLLATFMLSCDAEGRPYSDVFLRDVVTNFILAGRDTSGVALTWFFWLLDSHPDVEEKILEEVGKILDSRIQTEEVITAASRVSESCSGGVEEGVRACESEGKQGDLEDEFVAFTVDELKRMHFLHAALTESLRLYPSLPVDIKYAEKQDTLPDGTAVSAGFRVFYSIYAMARMPQIWGADCLQFNPERWLKNGIFKPESQFKYACFQLFVRCLGRTITRHMKGR